VAPARPPPPAARRRAASFNGDRISRAEIAWAVPAGSRRARSPAQFLRAAARCPGLGEVKREDRRRNLLEFIRIMARHVSWEDMTTRPTRARVCQLGGFSVSTFKVLRAQWEAWGFLGTVRKGRTRQYRLQPAVLDGDRNDAAVWVLAVPREKTTRQPAGEAPAAVTRPPTGSRSEPGTAHTRARRETPGDRTGLRPDSPAKPAVPRALALGAVLEKLSDRARAHFWRPFEAAGWRVADFRFAVDHLPDGRPHRRDLRDVIYPAGWLRWRLAHWLGPDGAPVASRSQRWAAAAAADRDRHARLRERLAAAAAAAAPPNDAWRAARALLGRGRPR
jgi:hypothetical protein